MKFASIAFAVVFVATALSATGAFAFNIDNRTLTKPDGSARFADPDQKLGSVTVRGNFTGSDSTLAQGDASRFIGSQNPGFNSPALSPYSDSRSPWLQQQR